MDVSAILTTHHSFYHQFFGLDLDLSTVRIPPQRPDFTRPLIIAQGLTPNQVYEVCQKRFPYSKYADDLDSVLDWDEEERNPKDGAYAIWVRDRVEADVELKNLSADQIKEKGLTTETLLERLLHGLMYWSETNKHLDTNTVTLCTGSRSRRGNVPNADWHRDRDEFRVGWCGPRSAHGNLRARAVVS
ncbi:MAG: hypothetical protein HY452_02645 [Parcubacteria group bacterium]|nr:hypothetical protein [Parcubacteria group bacterium]